MNISINPLKFTKIYQSKSHPQFQSLQHDCVSFSGVKNGVLINPHTKEAVDLGFALYSKYKTSNNVNIEKFIHQKAENVQILPMQDLKKYMPDADMYGAYFMHDISDDFTPINLKLFVQKPNVNASEAAKLDYIKNLSHEYTHLQQVVSGSQMRAIKEITNNNSKYAAILGPIGDGIFQPFDTQIQAEFVIKAFNTKDAVSQLYNGFIAPRESNITKQSLLLLNGFKDEQEFHQKIRKTFDDLYPEFIKYILSDTPMVDTNIKNYVQNMLSQDGGYEKLKKNLILYCAHNAQNEKEAYLSESELSKKVLKTDKPLNIDAFVIYYDMLSRAFNY